MRSSAVLLAVAVGFSVDLRRSGSAATMDVVVAPVNASHFFSAFFEAQPVHLRQREQSYLAGTFSSSVLDDVLEEGFAAEDARFRLHEGDLRIAKKVEKDGEDWTAVLPWPKDMSLGTVHEAFEAGFSVVLNGLELRWPAVQKAAALLEDETGIPCRANLYLTPPGQQAFEAHFDYMDGFVVQVEGAKEWVIYEPLVDRPRADLKYKPRREELREAQRVSLQPGDVLYIPRGWPHEAVAAGDTGADAPPLSLHITFGMEAAPDASREALLHALIDAAADAAEDLAGAAGFQEQAWAPWTAADALHVAVAAFGGSAAEGAAAVRAALPLLPGQTSDEDLRSQLEAAVAALGPAGDLADWACRTPGASGAAAVAAGGEREERAALDGAGRGQRAYVWRHLSAEARSGGAPRLCDGGAEPELRLRGALAEAAGRFADAAVELYRSRSDAARERRAALGSEALAALHRDSAFVESAATLRGEL